MNTEHQDFFTILRYIPDPRIETKTSHKLVDILVIALCAVAAGADTWDDIEVQGDAWEEWFAEFLELPAGIPSADTFARVFSVLDPQALEKALRKFVELMRLSVQTSGQREVIAVDGKVIKGSFDQASGCEAVHMVSAWAVEAGLILGQCRVDEKTNEITAVPKLLKQLALNGAVVTVDALNTQKATAAVIVEQKGDYVLALKENHPQLHEEVSTFFEEELKSQELEKAFQLPVYETVEKGHGRVETRRCHSCDDLTWLSSKKEWVGLRSIARIERERWIEEKRSHEIAYFLSSLPANSQEILRCVREHWGVENSVHWVLDVTFQEDKSRVRVKYAAENFSRVRRLALMLLKQAPPSPRIKKRRKPMSIRLKRKMCSWDPGYLLQTLFGSTAQSEGSAMTQN